MTLLLITHEPHLAAAARISCAWRMAGCISRSPRADRRRAVSGADVA